MRIQKTQKGFTFIELMVTVAIMAVGIVGIYRAFFISLDYLNHVTDRLYANVFLENKICTIQKEFIEEKAIPFHQSAWKADRAVLNHKIIDYVYNVHLGDIANIERILEMDLAILWKERNREITLPRSAYVSGY